MAAMMEAAMFIMFNMHACVCVCVCACACACAHVWVVPLPNPTNTHPRTHPPGGYPPNQ